VTPLSRVWCGDQRVDLTAELSERTVQAIKDAWQASVLGPGPDHHPEQQLRFAPISASSATASKNGALRAAPKGFTRTIGNSFVTT
jgi:hypothetical protein